MTFRLHNTRRLGHAHSHRDLTHAHFCMTSGPRFCTHDAACARPANPSLLFYSPEAILFNPFFLPTMDFSEGIKSYKNVPDTADFGA